MTVTYTAEVATCRGFGCFLKLLVRWRGSIYKLVWLDLVCFLLIYYTLNITYRLFLDEGQRRIFESVVKYCAAYSDLIPLSFVLGFYISTVMTRWWNQYISIPWPDSIAVFVSSIIHGQDERGRVMRRTIMRYVCLCLTMVLRNIAPRVKKRFPTLDHLVEAGLLLENERIIMDDLNEKFPPYSKHWLPIVWASSIVTRARKEGRIRDDFAVKTVIDEMNKFRGQCGVLISYDTISIPLVYTQVVTLAVYSFFFASVMGKQWVTDKKVDDGFVNTIDLYFPIFTTLQFFFYMGWLKVAESLINPFGEDDDDFEVNWIVDRNLQVSYIIVDEMHHDHPELIKDQYWDNVLPPELPYTIAAQNIRDGVPIMSTDKVQVSKANAEIIPMVPSSVKVNDMVGKSNQSVNYKFPENENELMDNDYGIHFEARGRPSTAASTNSMHSLARVSTVASALKKFFHREDSRTGGQNNENAARMANSASNISLTRFGTSVMQPGSVRLPDQVIEELDEQMTITSIRPPDIRPNIRDIFDEQQPTPSSTSYMPQSAPIDIPISRDTHQQPYARTQSSMGHVIESPSLFPPGGVDALLSASLTSQSSVLAGPSNLRPNSGEYDHKKSSESVVSKSSKHRADNFEQIVAGDIKPAATGEIKTADPTQPPTVTTDPQAPSDDFEKLRLAREAEKLERQKQKLTRTVSLHQQQLQTQPTLVDTDILIDDMLIGENLDNIDIEDSEATTPTNPKE